MGRIFLFLLVGFILTETIGMSVSAQSYEAHYWVSFTDKLHNDFSLEDPGAFLSERALQRRARQGIVLTAQDLPVSQQYVDSLERLGPVIINVSKWFNGAVIATDDQALIDTIDHLDFILGAPVPVRPSYYLKSSRTRTKPGFEDEDVSPTYGFSANQLEMLKADFLHDNGYTGEGLIIAVLDAGFTNADVISSLNHVWSDNRVLAMRDFVKDGKYFFSTHGHGTAVLSIMAGIEDDFLFGTAPHAMYLLVRTEDASSEYLIEEYNWVTGAEFADSAGADLINSSLGYSLFDDPAQNHTYSEMDGETAPVTRAAHIAAQKGMVVVTSAGNSGGPPWYKITAPADAENVLAVGAVDSAGVLATFSSRGPSFDQRVKPDVSAMGVRTVAQHPAGYFYYCAGTSCAAPLITGIAASLWQKFPGATSTGITNALRRSSSHYLTPDSLTGYGIPDLLAASHLLSADGLPADEGQIGLRVFPNPFAESFYVEIASGLTPSSTVHLELLDLQGRVLKSEDILFNNPSLVFQPQWAGSLATGMYVIRVRNNTVSSSVPVIKINPGR